MASVKSFKVNNIDSSIVLQASDTNINTIDGISATTVQSAIEELNNNIAENYDKLYVEQNVTVGYLLYTGEEILYNQNYVFNTEYISVEDGDSITFYTGFTTEQYQSICVYYDENKNRIDSQNVINGSTLTISSSNGAVKYIRCNFINDSDKTLYLTKNGEIIFRVYFEGDIVYSNTHIAVLEDFTGTKVKIDFINGYITTNVDTGTVIDINTILESGRFRHIVLPCEEGDVFTISGVGGNSPRLWAFTDENYALISKSANNITVENLILTVPIGAAYIIINTNSDANCYYQKYYTLAVAKADKTDVDNIESSVNNLELQNILRYFDISEYTGTNLTGLKCIIEVRGTLSNYYLSTLRIHTDAGSVYDQAFRVGVRQKYGTTEIARGFILTTDIDDYGIGECTITTSDGYLKFKIDYNLAKETLTSNWSDESLFKTVLIKPDADVIEESLQKIYDLPQRVLLQSEYSTSTDNLMPIPFTTPVTNPDNIVSWIISEPNLVSTAVNSLAYNNTTRMGINLRTQWCVFEIDNSDGTTYYDFNRIDDIMAKCIVYHTRMTIRIASWSGYPYDSAIAQKPSDWDEYSTQYDQELTSMLSTYYTTYSYQFNDSNILEVSIDNADYKQITLGFPSRVFWESVKEGYAPKIKLKSSTDTSLYAAVNYNSDTFYENYSKFLSAFNDFLNENVTDTSIKRRDMIEVLQMGAVGIFGEGHIRTEGVLPTTLDSAGNTITDTDKLYKYFELYLTLFSDISLAMPLAVSYDSSYSTEYLTKLLTLQDDYGYTGLYYDVIGQNNYHTYFEGNDTAYFIIKSTWDDRRIGGEGAGTLSTVNQDDLLLHAYACHFYGASLHNFNIPSKYPLGIKECQLFKTLMGAHLLLSPTVTYSNNILTYNIQNIGWCKVFCRYWESVLIFRNTDGTLIGEQTCTVQPQDIEPNSQEYEYIGYIQAGTEYNETITLDSLPTNYLIYYCIRDKIGVYENYWLHNYGRTDNGEYLLVTV